MMSTKTQERTAQKKVEKDANRHRQLAKQDRRRKRDEEIAAANAEFRAEVAKLQETRSKKLKAIWDAWRVDNKKL
jgi:hypothetical protein